jgi:hypothetical protein
VSVFSPVDEAFKDGYLVFSSIHDGVTFRYQNLIMRDLNLDAGKWHTLMLNYFIPAEHQPGDLLAGYVWYTGNSNLYIDDLKFELVEPNK